MKNLLLYSMLVYSLTTYSQIIKVSLDTVQEMNWPLNITLSEAEKYNLVEYTNLLAGHNTFTFDLNKKIATLIGSDNLPKEFAISKHSKTNTSYYFELNHNKYKTKVTVTEQLYGGSLLVLMYDYEKGDTISEGYFSRNVKVKNIK
jgi:hypothetical protein